MVLRILDFKNIRSTNCLYIKQGDHLRFGYFLVLALASLFTVLSCFIFLTIVNLDAMIKK